MSNATEPLPMDTKIRKVLYVTSRFPALSMTFVANEMCAIEKLGIKVDVATLWRPLGDHKGHPAEVPFLDRIFSSSLDPVKFFFTVFLFLSKPSVIVTTLKLLPGHLSSPWLFAKLLAAIPKGILVGREAKKKKYDLIHSHFLTTPTTVALIASKYSGVPYTCTAHAFDITSSNPRMVNGSIPLKCNEAKQVITISNYNKKDILDRHPKVKAKKISIIYNGVNTDFFALRPQERNFDGKTVNVVCISNLNEKKGHEYLIRSIHILKKRNVNITLRLYGKGPMHNSLLQLTEELGLTDSVFFEGAINQSQSVGVLHSADIFALASIPLDSGDADGLPTVLIESLSCGVPTISTDVTGIPEIVIDKKTGLLVPPRDEVQLAEAILWMIDHPKQSQEFAKNGRELVMRQFNGALSARQLLDCWTKAMQDK
jgi:glycosyltransferase involved in cell wall biosynthesis